jgi:thymidylate synthase (FAD)
MSLDIPVKEMHPNSIYSHPFATDKGTPYLQHPGIILVGKTIMTPIRDMQPFLGGYDLDLQFDSYLHDEWDKEDTSTLLCKTAGQLCYASFGPNRTWNRDTKRYMDNIKEQGHFSVLEHANYSFLLYGISRSFSLEFIRHRHASYSQMSQRYVNGKVLRFVERPEFVSNPLLHEGFKHRIDSIRGQYEDLTRSLQTMDLGGRKKVQQSARAVLNNEVEAPLIVTANARQWRHFIELRGSEYAETEIRRVALGIGKILQKVSPILFDEYVEKDYGDGVHGMGK